MLQRGDQMAVLVAVHLPGGAAHALAVERQGAFGVAMGRRPVAQRPVQRVAVDRRQHPEERRLPRRRAADARPPESRRARPPAGAGSERFANSAVGATPDAPHNCAARAIASTVANWWRRPRRARKSGTPRMVVQAPAEPARSSGGGAGAAQPHAGSSARPRNVPRQLPARIVISCLAPARYPLVALRQRHRLPVGRPVAGDPRGSTNVSASSTGCPCAPRMSSDSRRRLRPNTRDARFGSEQPGKITNRTLFAIKCSRRDRCSAVQPHLSRAASLCAPARQPSSATQVRLRHRCPCPPGVVVPHQRVPARALRLAAHRAHRRSRRHAAGRIESITPFPHLFNGCQPTKSGG